MMRILVLAMLAACSSKGDGGKSSGAAKETPAAAKPKELNASGTLELAGKVNGRFSWNKEMELGCACIHADEWNVGIPMTDGANNFVSIRRTASG